MSAAISPKPDVLVAAADQPTVWALVQEKPRIAVLAISADRERIVEEAERLAAIQIDLRDPVHHRWLIKSRNLRLV